MSVKTQFSTLSYLKRAAVVKAQSIVEIRLNEPTVGEIVAVYPEVFTNTLDISSGRVTYSGRLIVTVVYTDEAGKLCRIQKGAEFSHFADDENLAPALNGVCNLKCERTQVKRDGSAHLLAVVIGAEISVYGNSQIEYLSGASGAVCRNADKTVYNTVNFSGESEVDDDFELSGVSDVLIPAAEAIVTDCRTRAGRVEISGEIYMNLLAMRDSAPVSMDRTVPFKAQIECPEAVLERAGVCRAEVRDVSVTAKVNEDRGTCEVDFSATLSFNGQYSEPEEAVVIEDAFSLDGNLNLTCDEIDGNYFTGMKIISERITGLCACKAKLDYTCNFLAAVLPKAEYTRGEDGVEGSITATLLYEQNEEIRSAEVNLPFTLKLDANACGDVKAVVCGLSIRQRAEGECEAEAVIKLAVPVCEKAVVKFITHIDETETDCAPLAAISVYVPAAGDGLWETAKKLKQSPEDIQKTNPDLNFPLSGKERILIYRAKTI